MTFSASFRDCAQPTDPRLPLPSTRMTRSILDAQVRKPVVSSKIAQSTLLHSLNCNRRSDAGSEHVPRPTAGSLIARVLRRTPLMPQDAVHMELQALQSPRRQSLSQDSEPQLSVCSVSSQGVPPFAIGKWTERMRSRTPPPHSAEQPDQPSHSSTMQSTGQGFVLQLSVILRGGHFMPPFGCTRTEREFTSTPPPQVWEQTPADQSETSQSVT
mmetsp:Transcript_9512/g.25318  ORF Transcript_9512/g.25318 Transcript_9512/m.25318 type:complete len:214 (+) Transcript_9512:359-1000(+)